MVFTLGTPDERFNRMAKGGRLKEGHADDRSVIRREVVLDLYARGAVSLGKAVELAGMTRADFEEILAVQRIERPYNLTELDRDLAWAKREG